MKVIVVDMSWLHGIVSNRIDEDGKRLELFRVLYGEGRIIMFKDIVVLESPFSIKGYEA